MLLAHEQKCAFLEMASCYAEHLLNIAGLHILLNARRRWSTADQFF